MASHKSVVEKCKRAVCVLTIWKIQPKAWSSLQKSWVIFYQVAKMCIIEVQNQMMWEVKVKTRAPPKEQKWACLPSFIPFRWQAQQLVSLTPRVSLLSSATTELCWFNLVEHFLLKLTQIGVLSNTAALSKTLLENSYLLLSVSYGPISVSILPWLSSLCIASPLLFLEGWPDTIWPCPHVSQLQRLYFQILP